MKRGYIVFLLTIVGLWMVASIVPAEITSKATSGDITLNPPVTIKVDQWMEASLNQSGAANVFVISRPNTTYPHEPYTKTVWWVVDVKSNVTTQNGIGISVAATCPSLPKSVVSILQYTIYFPNASSGNGWYNVKYGSQAGENSAITADSFSGTGKTYNFGIRLSLTPEAPAGIYTMNFTVTLVHTVGPF